MIIDSTKLNFLIKEAATLYNNEDSNKIQYINNRFDDVFENTIHKYEEDESLNNNIEQAYSNVNSKYFKGFNKVYIPYKKGEFAVFCKPKLFVNEAKTLHLYPVKPEKFINELKNTLGLFRENNIYISTKTHNDIPAFIQIIVHPQKIVNGFIEKLCLMLHSYGYFLTSEFQRDKSKDIPHIVWIFQFEPNYYKEYKEKDITLFHVTPYENEKSIKKNGLKANCKNPKFQYPECIYFFTEPNKFHINRLFYKFGTFSLDSKNTNLISIFRIAINPLLDNGIEFYSDPNYNEDLAVYTYEQEIHPNFLDSNIKHDII